MQNNEVNAENFSGRSAGGGIFAQDASVIINGGTVQYNCANGTANDGGTLTKAVFAHGGGVFLANSSNGDTSLTVKSGSISKNWCKQPYAGNGYGGNVDTYRFSASNNIFKAQCYSYPGRKRQNFRQHGYTHFPPRFVTLPENYHRLAQCIGGR